MNLRRLAWGLLPSVVVVSAAWCAPQILGTVTVDVALKTGHSEKPAVWTGKLTNGFVLTLNAATHSHYNQTGAPGLTYTVVAGKKAPSDDPTPVNPIVTFTSRKPSVYCYLPKFANDSWYSVIIHSGGAASPWYAFKTGTQRGTKVTPAPKSP